jgi:hypothetical protein
MREISGILICTIEQMNLTGSTEYAIQ